MVVMLLLYSAIANAEVSRHADESGTIVITDQAHPPSQTPGQTDSSFLASEAYDRFISTIRQFQHWIKQPYSSYILLFAGLSILILYVQSLIVGFLIRFILKLVFVGLLSVALYTFVVKQQLPSVISKLKGPSGLPDIPPLHEIPGKLKEMQGLHKKRQEMMESILQGKTKIEEDESNPGKSLPPKVPPKVSIKKQGDQRTIRIEGADAD